MKDDDIDTTHLKRKIAAHAKSSAEGTAWSDIRRKAIIDVLLRNDGKTVAAAREFGINRIQMWRYRKMYGV